MVDFTVILADEVANITCGVCSEVTLWAKGPRLLRADNNEPVCRDCARKYAPQLWSLIELAQVADKVGRHSRHLLTPAMKSLLELARAAETFASAVPPLRAKAG